MNAQRGRCVDELADAGVDALLYACLVAVMAQGAGEHRRVEEAVADQLAERGAARRSWSPAPGPWSTRSPRCRPAGSPW